jgi:FkbM family methyltransferase
MKKSANPNYLRASIKRKIARRRFRKYEHTILNYDFPGTGAFQYARWNNPLSMGQKLHEEQFQYYRNFIKEGDLAIDIGANIGDTTVPMAILAGKKGMVLGFECNPVIFEILNINAGLNPDNTNINAIPYAISDKDEEFYYNSSEASLSNGGISKKELNDHGKFGLQQKVKSVNLEKYLNNEYPDWIERLTFIKTDTEGHDLIILKSIRNLISRTQPVIDAECFKRATKEERKEIFDMFADLKYMVYYVNTFESASRSAPLKLNDFYRMDHFDFLAIPGN